jgi:hypothetical protein
MKDDLERQRRDAIRMQKLSGLPPAVILLADLINAEVSAKVSDKWNDMGLDRESLDEDKATAAYIKYMQEDERGVELLKRLFEIRSIEALKEAVDKESDIIAASLFPMLLTA